MGELTDIKHNAALQGWSGRLVKIESLEMLMEDKKNSMVSEGAEQVRDGSIGVDDLLEGLTDGRLGKRIAQAARLAYARHMLGTAQQMWSDVESENST